MRFSMTLGLVTSALALASCGSETSGTFSDEDGNSGEYTIDAENGETSFTVETEDGKATMRSGPDVEIDLPDGFSMYPGGEVIQNTRIAQGEGAVVGVTLESSDDASDIVAHYIEQAKAAGYKIEMEMTTDQMVMTGGSNDEGGQFTVTATQSEGSSTAQLSFADNLED